MTEQARGSHGIETQNDGSDVFIPEKNRLRDEALEDLYTTAVDQLRNGDKEVFTTLVNGRAVKNIRVTYSTERIKHIVLTTPNVTDEGVMAVEPDTIDIGGIGFDLPKHTTAFRLTRDEQGAYRLKLLLRNRKRGLIDKSFKPNAEMIQDISACLK